MNLEKNAILSYIEREYGVKIFKADRIEVGISNACYIAKTEKSKIFIKIMPKDNNSFKQELSFLEYLNVNNIPVLLPIKNRKKSYITYHGNQIILVYPFIPEAANNTKECYDEKKIRKIAELMAKLNSLKIDESLPKNRRNIKRTKIYKFQKCCQDKELKKYVCGNYSKLKKILNQSHLKKSIVHGDLWPENVVFDNNGNILLMIDTEDLEINDRLHDISVILLCVGYKNNKIALEKIKRYINYYEEFSPLEQNEKEHLFDYILLTLYWAIAWRYYDFNIKQQNKNQVDSYKILISRIDELNDIGKNKFFKSVFM